MSGLRVKIIILPGIVNAVGIFNGANMTVRSRILVNKYSAFQGDNQQRDPRWHLPRSYPDTGYSTVSGTSIFRRS